MKRSILQGTLCLTIASLILTACGGGGAAGGTSQIPSLPAQPPPTFQYTGSSALAVTWASQYVKQAQYLGPLTHEMVMSVNVALQPQNGAGLVAYAQQASTPGSANYRRFLTPQQIGQMYGASQNNTAAVANYFKGYQLSVGGWPQHLMLAVGGTTTNLGRAFGTTFGWYRLGSQTFVAPISAPHLTQAEAIGPVTGLSGYNAERTFIIRPSNSQFIGMSPQQLAHGFDFSGAYSSGITGTGITVGIIGTGPIDVSASGDGAALASVYKANLAPIAIATVEPQDATATNGGGTANFDFNPAGLASPPPVTGPCSQPTPFGPIVGPVANYQTCNAEDGEAQLDTQSVASLAPGSNVKFYLAFNDGVCVTSAGNFALPTAGACPGGDLPYQEEGIQLADDEVQQAIADNSVDVLSLSYGLGENDAQAAGYWGNAPYSSGPGPLEFGALAAEGIAVFASSGDTGNQSCYSLAPPHYPLTSPCVSYPASDVSVTGVGGVNIPLDNAGNVIGEITAWADTTTNGGNGSFGNNIGSGGGLSQFFSAPSFQSGLTVAANPNPASTTNLNGMRAVPDVAMDADPSTGPAIAINAEFGGGIFDIGGTSAAAPEMAAVWALVLQACKASATCAVGPYVKPYRLGRAADALYAVYNGKGHLPYANSIYDVLYGENQAILPAGAQPPASVTGCCTAGVGYDMVTGVGAPSVGHLIQAITGTTVP